METNRRCVVCGQPLPPRRTKYCGAECARIGANNLSRAVTSKRPRPQTFRLITCIDCGLSIVRPIKSIRCVSCQEEANRRHAAEFHQRKRLGKIRPIGSIDLCQRCGQPYTVSSGLQKYCKDCAHIATLENDRASSREWSRENYASQDKRAERNEGRRRPTPEAVQCPICGNTFTPASTRGVYCSPECADKAHKAMVAQYQKEHRQAINARARVNYKKRKEAKK